jgi:hypothetical protein
MFLGKARVELLEGASIRYVLASPKRLAKDKHSSLLQKSVIYGCKNLYRVGPGRYKPWQNIDFYCYDKSTGL